MKKRKSHRSTKMRRQALGLAIIIVCLVGGAGLLARNLLSTGDSNGVTVKVVTTALSEEALAGAAVFKTNCQACHGENAAGTKLGPPLIHDIYNPGHHSDKAFYLAASIGVRQHHWPYGDMPAQPQVTEADMTKIIRFIRELQEANGIVTKRYGG